MLCHFSTVLEVSGSAWRSPDAPAPRVFPWSSCVWGSSRITNEMRLLTTDLESHIPSPAKTLSLLIESIDMPVAAAFISIDYFHISVSLLNASTLYSENAFDHCAVVKCCSMLVFLHMIPSSCYIKLCLFFLKDYNFFFLLAREDRKEQGQRESHKQEGWKWAMLLRERHWGLPWWSQEGGLSFSLLTPTECKAASLAVSSIVWEKGKRRILIIWKVKDSQVNWGSVLTHLETFQSSCGQS